MPEILSISNALIRIDQFSDYIPAASTVTNFVDIFEKCVFREFKTKGIDKNRYFFHIKNKSILRCIVLLVPILGNIFIGLHDLILYKRVRKHQDFRAHALGINVKQLPWCISKRNEILENKQNEKLRGAAKPVIESLDKQIVGLRQVRDKFTKIINNPNEPLETNAFFKAPRDEKSHQEKIDYFWTHLKLAIDYIDGGIALIGFGVLNENKDINQRMNEISLIKNDLQLIKENYLKNINKI